MNVLFKPGGGEMPEAGEAASKSASVNLQTLPLPQPNSMINAGRVQLGDQGASANTDPSLTILVAAYLQRATQIVSQNRKQDQSTYPSLGDRLNQYNNQVTAHHKKQRAYSILRKKCVE